MPDARRFESLRLELLHGGVAPAYIERTLLELDEHLTDLKNAALAAGLPAEEAAQSALTLLGDPRAIAAAVLARPELLDFRHRWPRTSSCLHRIAGVAALPGLPIVYCIDRSAQIARWTAASGLAAMLVAAMLTWLNWMTLVE